MRGGKITVQFPLIITITVKFFFILKIFFKEKILRIKNKFSNKKVMVKEGKRMQYYKLL